MPDKYTELFIHELTETSNATGALLLAAKNYVNIRQSWLDCKSSSWRWGWTSGKLRFDRSTTRANIDVMRQVVELLESDRESKDFNSLLQTLKKYKDRLSPGGHGRKLLEAYLVVTRKRHLSMIPHNYTSGTDSVVMNGQMYTKSWPDQISDTVEAYLYETEDQQQSLVVKNLPQSKRESLKVVRDRARHELKIFEKVYRNPKLYPHEQTSEVDTFEYVEPHPGKMMATSDGKVKKVACSLLTPPVSGISLKQFALTDKFQQGREIVYFKMFSFLKKLHRMKIVHGDCDWKSVKIISRAYDVFLISYNTALEAEDLDRSTRLRNWNDFLKADLAKAITNIFKADHYASRQPRFDYHSINERNLRYIVKTFQLDFWVGKHGIYRDFFKFFIEQRVMIHNLMKAWLGENKWAHPRPDVYHKMFGIDD
ncbi:hypothetical protein P0136_00440 [Lentisphaerota bacterium ZTH]|nr:hypothetical protein JYG24_08415 [Lentisphaerota bacterium]WET06482.1 hypothetical protein P0136_00440 [Lentisphaerota bacterium ZTH]